MIFFLIIIHCSSSASRDNITVNSGKNASTLKGKTLTNFNTYKSLANLMLENKKAEISRQLPEYQSEMEKNAKEALTKINSLGKKTLKISQTQNKQSDSIKPVTADAASQSSNSVQTINKLDKFLKNNKK